MISAYIREQERYTQLELSNKFGGSFEEIIPVIRKLKEYGIVKIVKAIDSQKDMSELLDEDVEISDVTLNDNEHFYVFTFVGVISIAGRILICYPKYLSKGIDPNEDMQQIIKVLEKYNSREQIIKLFNDSTEGKEFNLLAVLLYLLQDYDEYGPYNNTEDIIEHNGTGEILWDRTINDTFAFISNNRPFYPVLKTHKRVTNEFDYFKRLHDCIVTQASKELDAAHLLDLFELSGVDVSDELVDDFGEKDYILYRIEKELATQFNTRKQLVLKTMYAYIAHNAHLFDLDGISFIGTNSFNLVWEDVCKKILNDKLETKLKSLGISLDAKYTSDEFDNGDCKLLDVIEKPLWSITGVRASATLKPDIVSIDKGRFIIFDAKYYNPVLEQGLPPKGQPGIESITKQFLYQMAYQEFINLNGLSPINCFIIPTADPQADIYKGHVEMSFLRNKEFKLENIQVRLLPVHEAYEKYLSGKAFPLEALKLESPFPSIRTIK